MKVGLSFFALLFFTTISYAQNDSRLAKGINPISTVQKVVLPVQNNEALLQEELNRRSQNTAPRFALDLEVDITPSTHGNWEISANGALVWRLVIESAGAKSINLGFTKYNMPKEGSMILYSPDYQNIIGPFTPADNEEHEQLWTPVLPSDIIVIEVQLPQKSQSELSLELKYVNHDFLGFGAVASGSCNIDVICGALDGWAQIDNYRDIIRSVAVIGSEGVTFCTGFLVNNTRNDCTPFFMTAKHCSITSANAPSVVAYWNFENSYCREIGSDDNSNDGDGSLNIFNTGAIHRAGGSATDFTLLELDDPVSENANAFFAGWSIEAIEPTSAIGIHHPGGDEKRISFDNDELMLTNGLNSNPDANFTHIRVIDWDHGTTELGSSGSPLFDQNKRVVGQLHGGAAACSNDKSDWYGAFAVSWEGGGTSSTRLKNWLDPDNLQVTTLEGREMSACNIFVTSNPNSVELCAPSNNTFQIGVSENFESTVELSVTTNIPGIEMPVFEDDTVMPGDSTQLYLIIDPSVLTGDYTLDVYGTDGISTESVTIEVNVFETSPSAIELSTPSNEALFTSIIPRFRWMEDSTEMTFDIQIATDPSFSNIIETISDLDTNFYDNTTLDVLTQYFWRVRGKNICGDGIWSEPFSFTTADIECLSTSSFDVPVIIPEEDASTISSIIEIEENGEVTDVDIKSLDIYHSWVGDLLITIESPSGIKATLMDQPGVPASNFGCPEDNLFLNFDDETSQDYESLDTTCNGGNMAITGTYQPFESLKVFNGEIASGTWKLTIEDLADGDGGNLNGWDLNICSTIIPDLSISSNMESSSFCIDQAIVFQITVGEDFEGDVYVSTSGNPVGSAINLSTNTVQPGGAIDVTILGINATGTFPILFTANDGTYNIETEIIIEIVDFPAAPQLIFPPNNQTGVSLTPTLSWDESEFAAEYLIEVAEDQLFNNIITSIFQDSLTVTIPPLNQNQEYFWRVTAKNSCGDVMSPIYRFTTDIIDDVKNLEDDEIQIFPNPTDGKLFIHYSKPKNGKVTIELFSPNGQMVRKIENDGYENEMEIDLKDLSNGIYWLRAVKDNFVLSQKIVLQK